RNNTTPNFALFIGAGTSASSGIKTASQMITEWRRQLYDPSKSDETFEEWLKEQDWYEDEEEYSILFEKTYDQRSQRRVYIEECVKDAKPSWGYIYLANIIAHNYFNVIFTTNFDDVLNEACFLYADLRPIVCAHDSAVADIRITSARPKIIKLHGDFLYDSIKNTVRETENLEKNMRDKFMQFAREYGLVVIGYGGNDRSIMDILDTILKSEGDFPNGLYWCKRKGDKASKKLERLMRRDNAYWVEIDGFDEFTAELHDKLGIRLPDTVRDPFKATTERLNRFISHKEEIKNPIIRKDVKELENQVKSFRSKEDFDRLVPYVMLGEIEFTGYNYEKALTYYEDALIRKPDDLAIMDRIALSYSRTGKFDECLKMSERMIQCAPAHYSGYYRKGRCFVYLGKLEDAIASYDESLKYATEKTKHQSNVLVSRSNVFLLAGNWEKALSDAERALLIEPEYSAATINKCIALKKLNRAEEANEILQKVLTETKHKYLRACAFAVLGDKENMLKELAVAIEEDSSNRVDAKFDPDFADYRDDPDFRKLVYVVNLSTKPKNNERIVRELKDAQ
ncbi:Tetratricopeptide (TPR) repeat, partial [Candidatus Methanophagaceae archaeon]